MRLSVIIAALASMTGFAAPALAQSWPDLSTPAPVEKIGANDIAVVVAIEDYAFLPDVPGATKNAADWEAFLTDGLGVERVLMLTNQQAVREEILSFAQKAADSATPDSTVWFIFVGHGGPAKSGDDGLLIGADGQQNVKSMAARGLPQRELLKALESGKQGRTVVLIDACFSGRDQSGGALAKGAMPVVALNAVPAVASSTVVMTAAKADEFAGDLPGADRPAFSYLVLGAMRGWADDGDGEVTASEALRFARRKLMGISGRQQTPQLIGLDDSVLARGVSEPQPEFGPEPPTSSRPTEPVVSTRQAATPTGPPPDGKPDKGYYVNAHVGAMLSGGNSIGWGFTGGAGAKLGEFRLGALVGLANPADPNVPPSGNLETDRGGDLFTVDSSTGNGTNNLGGIVAATVGYGLRNETQTRDDVLWVDAVAGLSIAKKCDSYSYSTEKSKIVCGSTTSSATGPLFGGRVGGKFGFLSASALAGFRTVDGTGDLMLLFAAGVALDD